jgi:hypothetical protein
LEEKQILANNPVRLAGIWLSACIRHIAEQESFRQKTEDRPAKAAPK